MQVNGKPMDGFAGQTVAALLEAQGFKPERVAVERNGEIVRRADFGTVTLADDDAIEIVHFVGGG